MPAPTESQQADALEAALSDEERALLDRLADGIARRRLQTAAIFFLESIKPLGFVSSQALRFFQPLVEIVTRDATSYARFAAILERRGSVELLLRRLEALS